MILILTIIILALVIRHLNINKGLKKIEQKLINIAGDGNVKRILKNKAFDFEVSYNSKTYLVKMIYHPTCAEINVNSRDYWQINKGTVSSRKSGEQMKGVYDLINFKLTDNNYPKNTVKLYVIYPDSKCLMKVLNECEMKFITPDTDIYGTKVNRFIDLEENFPKL